MWYYMNTTLRTREISAIWTDFAALMCYHIEGRMSDEN
jgi:hypothetical protein